MLVLETIGKTWPMCLASLGSFIAVAALAWKAKAPRLERTLPSNPIAWGCLAAWLLLMSVILTLVDKPAFDISYEAKDWLFMFSAFLGIPLSVPLLACGIWALAHQSRGEPVKLSALALVSLVGLGVGCAASNMHDVVWCGVKTGWYTEHCKAGFDLDIFVAFAKVFGIPKDVSQDYATLGPYTMFLVAGELLVAAASLDRLRRVAIGYGNETQNPKSPHGC